MPLTTLGAGDALGWISDGAAGFQPCRRLRVAAAGRPLRAVARGDAAGGTGAGAARPGTFCIVAGARCRPAGHAGAALSGGAAGAVWRAGRGRSGRPVRGVEPGGRGRDDRCDRDSRWCATCARAPHNTPAAAVAAAGLAGAGPVLNDYSFGGYSIFAGIPTFIDGRGDCSAAHSSCATIATCRWPTCAIFSNCSTSTNSARRCSAGHAGGGAARPLPDWQRVYSDDVAVVHSGGMRLEAIAQAVPKTAYCAPSGTLPQAPSTTRAGFASRATAGNSARRSRASRRPPAFSAPCRRRAGPASRSNSQRDTASRGQRIERIVLDDADQSPGPHHAPHLVDEMRHSAGATWCSTQIAVARSKPASSKGKLLAVEALVVDVAVVGARLRDAGRGNVNAAEAADHAAQQG